MSNNSAINKSATITPKTSQSNLIDNLESINTRSNIIENKSNKKKSNLDKIKYFNDDGIYLCPCCLTNCYPKFCYWTLYSFDGCSRAWKNPFRAIKRLFQCCPEDNDRKLIKCAECSCIYCPSNCLIDTCVICLDYCKCCC